MQTLVSVCVLPSLQNMNMNVSICIVLHVVSGDSESRGLEHLGV